MEKKRDKNNKIKKVDINGKVKVIYCNPLNKRVDYVRANGHYIKLVDYKKMQRKSKKYRGVGKGNDDFYNGIKANIIDTLSNKNYFDKDVPISFKDLERLYQKAKYVNNNAGLNIQDRDDIIIPELNEVIEKLKNDGYKITSINP